MSDNALRRLADTLLGFCVLMMIALLGAIVVSLTGGNVLSSESTLSIFTGLVFAVDVLVFAAVGALITHRQPRNTIGWLLLTVATLWTLWLTANIYADYGINEARGSVPAPALVDALVVWTWIAAVGLISTFMLLLFPDGHLPSPRWRWLAWLSGAVIVVNALGWVTDPGAFQGSALNSVANPLAIHRATWLVATENWIFALFPLCLIGCAVAAISRYRHTTGVERLQMKWLVTAGAFLAIFFGVMLLIGTLPVVHDKNAWNALVGLLVPVTLVLFPLAIGAAVLKYRLYDIDVVISKSLVFGALATFITAVYVAIVVGIGHLFDAGNRPNLALSIAATAIVAVAFEPVRNRLQTFANRVVYGERATPYEVLSSFADRMGGAYDTTQLLPLMARTVGHGVDAVQSQVWLRRDDGFDLAATWTPGNRTTPGPRLLPSLDDIAGDRIVTVTDQGELLGAVAVVKAPGTSLTPVEEKLLETLAAQAGPVLRNVRLIEDLRGSRQRLVATQDDERRRLERNLHDGAQQSLVAVALMIRLVQPKVATQDQGAAASLDQAGEELGRAIEDLRALARGIYPVVLTERGLGAALSSLAERLPVPIEVDDRLDGRVDAGVERALYFIAFEALSSAPRAGAREVHVRLDRSETALVLRIDDDGAPLDDPGRGLALQNLLDRAAVATAALEVVEGPSGLHLVCNVGLPDLAPTDESENTDVTAVPLGAGQ